MDVRSAFSELKNPPSISVSQILIEALVLLAVTFALLYLV